MVRQVCVSLRLGESSAERYGLQLRSGPRKYMWLNNDRYTNNKQHHTKARTDGWADKGPHRMSCGHHQISHTVYHDYDVVCCVGPCCPCLFLPACCPCSLLCSSFISQGVSQSDAVFFRHRYVSADCPPQAEASVATHFEWLEAKNSVLNGTTFRALSTHRHMPRAECLVR